MAANWGVKGRQRGRQRAAVGAAQGGKGASPGTLLLRGGGRQSNYGGSSGGRQFCVTGHWCDMLASSWRQVGAKLASSRLQWLIALGYNYLTRPRPQLIPYFDAEGQLIGMVRLRPDPQSLRQLELRARPTEAQELSRDVSPDMPPQSHENRVSRQSHDLSSSNNPSRHLHLTLLPRFPFLGISGPMDSFNLLSLLERLQILTSLLRTGC
ncbi:hypothetical protein B0H14DRAFT_2601584 [Mycena olivaceomarginata]|nr:hypothetical protein B0H14DRAFT_2601584 [Mycena olivaceomarginata]